MSSSNLIRWGGLVAVLAGVLLVFVDLVSLLVLGLEVLGFEQSPSEGGISFALLLLRSITVSAARALLVLGLVGLYAHHSEAAGIPGLVSFLVAFLGTVLAQSFDPLILLASLGWALFGVSCLRARVYPRVAANLLVTGAVLTAIIRPVPTDGMGTILAYLAAAMLLNVSIVWLGFSLFTRRTKEPAKEKNEKAPAREPAAINLSGFGQTATESFNLEGGLAIFLLTHQGGGHFSGTLLDQNGQRAGGTDSLLVNVVGPFDGSKALQTKAGQHLIDIFADGPWTITVEQPRPSSAPQTTSFQGNSQAATDFFELSEGLKRFQMTHQGSGHFGVTLLNKDGSRIGMKSLLANEVGPFDGSKAARIRRNDLYLLQVSADGPWTVQIE
jgi:hypothetical protein